MLSADCMKSNRQERNQKRWLALSVKPQLGVICLGGAATGAELAQTYTAVRERIKAGVALAALVKEDYSESESDAA